GQASTLALEHPPIRHICSSTLQADHLTGGVPHGCGVDRNPDLRPVAPTHLDLESVHPPLLEDLSNELGPSRRIPVQGQHVRHLGEKTTNGVEPRHLGQGRVRQQDGAVQSGTKDPLRGPLEPLEGHSTHATSLGQSASACGYSVGTSPRPTAVSNRSPAGSGSVTHPTHA